MASPYLYSTPIAEQTLRQGIAPPAEQLVNAAPCQTSARQRHLFPVWFVRPDIGQRLESSASPGNLVPHGSRNPSRV